MTRVICAIHQPNFFPWLGFFDKIKRADIFIFLDAVNYPRSGSGGMGSWTNRVQINIQGKPSWIGCPIERAKSDQLIKETKICNRVDWRRKLLETMRHSYSKRKNYAKAMELLSPLILCNHEIVSEYNIHAIKSIAQALKINCEFVRQSELKSPGNATELLINLIHAARGNAYLCGGGAQGYQEDSLFRERSVELIYQGFKPELYGDPRHYIPGLSIIDYLMEADW